MSRSSASAAGLGRARVLARAQIWALAPSGGAGHRRSVFVDGNQRRNDEDCFPVAVPNGGSVRSLRMRADHTVWRGASASGCRSLNTRVIPITGSRTGGRPYRLVMHGSPPDGPCPIAARAGGDRRTGAGRRLFDHASGGEAPIGGRSRSRGPPARRRIDERRGGGGAQFVGTGCGATEKRGPQFPGMCRVCPRPGRSDYAVLVSGTESADG
jgi:hypothetical protein